MQDAQPQEALIEARESFSKINPYLQIAWDSVSLRAAKKCARYYQLSIIEGWQTKKQSHHLRYGILYHRALEVYDHHKFEGKPHNECVAASLWDLVKGCTDYQQVIDYEAGAGPNGEVQFKSVAVWWDPNEWIENEEKRKANAKTVPNLFRTVIWYLDQFKNDPCETVRLANGKPAVELSFRYDFGYTFRTGEQMMHSGHLDRLVKLGEMFYVLDRKTSQQTVDSSYYFKKFSPDTQMTGYTFASKVALAMPVAGVIIDAAQIAKGFSRFERGFSMRDDGSLDEFHRDTLEWVQKFEDYAEKKYWPMNDNSCDMYGGCDFRDICSRAPSIRKALLSTDFIKKPWDPLKVRGDI